MNDEVESWLKGWRGKVEPGAYENVQPCVSAYYRWGKPKTALARMGNRGTYLNHYNSQGHRKG